jgi:hypothetical protein
MAAYQTVIERDQILASIAEPFGLRGIAPQKTSTLGIRGWRIPKLEGSVGVKDRENRPWIPRIVALRYELRTYDTSVRAANRLSFSLSEPALSYPFPIVFLPQEISL